MAATIIINEWNGTVGVQSATSKSGDTIRFKSADNAEVDTNDTLRRPNAGVYRSYEKWLRTNISDLGDSTNVSNLELFTTSSADTGLTIWAATADSYCNAEGDPEADQITPKAGGYQSAGALQAPKENLFLYTSASPLSLGVGPFTVNADDGDIVEAGIGSYVVLQMDVSPSAAETPNSTTRAYSLILRYDEE